MGNSNTKLEGFKYVMGIDPISSEGSSFSNREEKQKLSDETKAKYMAIKMLTSMRPENGKS